MHGCLVFAAHRVWDGDASPANYSQRVFSEG